MNLQKRVIKAWSSMPAGGKARVFKLGHTQRSIDYVLNTPKYKNEAKMELLLNAMKQASKDIAKEVSDCNKKVQKA